MRIRTVDISPEVRAVLEHGRWDRNYFHLTGDQLPRPLYEATDKVLRALGGRWKRQYGAHEFASEAADQLRTALDQGHVVDQKKTLEQFFTPPELARRMAEIALSGMGHGNMVLEPSAGGGALIDAALAAGATSVVAIELDEQLAERLTADDRVSALRGDFLSVPVLSLTPDVVIMNPPFSRNQDIAHVHHAFAMLRPGGRLVAIMSPHFTFAEDQPSREFRELIGFPGPEAFRNGESVPVEAFTAAVHAVVQLLPAGSFKAEGTNVSAVLVTIEKGR